MSYDNYAVVLARWLFLIPSPKTCLQIQTQNNRRWHTSFLFLASSFHYKLSLLYLNNIISIFFTSSVCFSNNDDIIWKWFQERKCCWWSNRCLAFSSCYSVYSSKGIIFCMYLHNCFIQWEVQSSKVGMDKFAHLDTFLHFFYQNRTCPSIEKNTPTLKIPICLFIFKFHLT